MIKEKKKCTKLSKNKKNIEINFLPHEEIFYEKKKWTVSYFRLKMYDKQTNKNFLFFIMHR